MDHMTPLSLGHVAWMERSAIRELLKDTGLGIDKFPDFASLLRLLLTDGE